MALIQDPECEPAAERLTQAPWADLHGLPSQPFSGEDFRQYARYNARTADALLEHAEELDPHHDRDGDERACGLVIANTFAVLLAQRHRGEEEAPLVDIRPQQRGFDIAESGRPLATGDVQHGSLQQIAGGIQANSNQPPLYYALTVPAYVASPWDGLLERMALMRLVSALLAAVTTGEPVFREDILPGAVLTPSSW